MKSTDTIRWGIVGSGMMALEHIANIALTPNAVVTALADPVATSLDRAAAAVGSDVARFADAAALAASGLCDAVVIASPNFTHIDVLPPLMDARLHILCEKPLATTIGDARVVADAAAGYSPVFWTAMEYRFMPPVSDSSASFTPGAPASCRCCRFASIAFRSSSRSATGTGFRSTPVAPWSKSAAISST